MTLRLSVRSRIWGMLLLFLLAFALFGAVHIWSGHRALLDEKKLKTRHLVEAALAVLGHYESQVRRGELAEATAQQAARDTLRAMRYGDGDYFWIQDARQPVMLMHPTQPALEGTRLDEARFDRVTSLQFGKDGPVVATDGHGNMGVLFNRLANEAGGGFATYDWPKAANQPLQPKLSYVARFAPWNWVVGSGIYIDDVAAAVRADALRYLLLIGGIGGILAILAALLARSIAAPLRRAADQLTAMSEDGAQFGPLAVNGNEDDEIGALIAGYNRLQDALHEREDSLRLAASVYENAQDGIMVTDTAGNIVAVNAAFTRLTGYPADEVLGQNPRLLASGRTPPETYRALWQALRAGGTWQGELCNRHRNGELFHERLSIASVHDAAGAPTHYVAMMQDISEQIRLTEQLRQQAQTDFLTGLANRRHFLALAQRELERRKRYPQPLALAMLDLDHFKAINDAHGHDTGDLVLQAFAASCQRLLRATDVVGRLGGEEFAILFPQTDAAQALEVGERLRAEIAAGGVSRPQGLPIRYTVSIGIAAAQGDDANIDMLLSRADAALYRAKADGRNCSRLAG